jgi:hypothetical protein
VELATEAEETAAREAYVAAKKHYDAGRLEPALAGFRQSHDIVASPNSHLMVARVLDQMERHAEAFEEMRATMREAERVSRLSPELAKKYARTLATATKLTAELRQKVGIVVVELVGSSAVPAGAELSIGGRDVDAVKATAVVQPGQVRVRLTTPSGVREATAVVAPGGEARVRLTVPASPPPTPPAPQPPPPDDDGVSIPAAFGYGAAVVGGVGFVLFAVFGALTIDEFSGLEDACPQNRCPVTSQPDIEDGKTYQTVANVGMTVGIAGGIAALALFLVDLSTDDARVQPAPGGVRVRF